MVKNYNEVLVEQYLHELLDSDPKYKDTCRCEECIDDMMAKTLNNIKPFYVTSKRGEVYGQFRSKDLQVKSDIIQELVRAVEWVSRYAHHG